jgi:hypothetical protein
MARLRRGRAPQGGKAARPLAGVTLSRGFPGWPCRSNPAVTTQPWPVTSDTTANASVATVSATSAQVRRASCAVSVLASWGARPAPKPPISEPDAPPGGPARACRSHGQAATFEGAPGSQKHRTTETPGRGGTSDTRGFAVSEAAMGVNSSSRGAGIPRFHGFMQGSMSGDAVAPSGTEARRPGSPGPLAFAERAAYFFLPPAAIRTRCTMLPFLSRRAAATDLNRPVPASRPVRRNLRLRAISARYPSSTRCQTERRLARVPRDRRAGYRRPSSRSCGGQGTTIRHPGGGSSVTPGVRVRSSHTWTPRFGASVLPTAAARSSDVDA